jgi:hypothetical protein
VIPSAFGSTPLANEKLSDWLELLEAVDVMRRELAIDLDLHGIQSEGVLWSQRHEQRDLRTRRVQQPLLECAELRRDAQDIRLDLLYLPVEALHVTAGKFVGSQACRDSEYEPEQEQGPDESRHRVSPFSHYIILMQRPSFITGMTGRRRKPSVVQAGDGICELARKSTGAGDRQADRQFSRGMQDCDFVHGATAPSAP